ncbi:MAG TPA: class I SAM-dependent methyltransferase [Patescibacteria group bacterium]|nr:class I SAM-dependent methyltransferase [Patescibacteria group bacterium]
MLSILQRYNSLEKINKLASCFLNKKETVLDFGCGDLSFAKAFKKKRSSVEITVVDVVDFHNRDKKVTFVHYDGKKLPFKNKSFDTVIAFHVLHHTTDAKKYFKELVRVAKKRILLVESVARTPLDFPGMRFMDWVFNIWKPEKVPMTYQFFSRQEWYKEYKKAKVEIISETDAEIAPIPSFFPTGRSTLFELKKR